MSLPGFLVAPQELGRRLLDRVGLAGLIISSAAMVTLDFIATLDSTLSLMFTSIETALVLPWAWIVLRLDKQVRAPGGRGWSNRTVLFVHSINLLLLLACLYQKWHLVLMARAGAESAMHQYRMFTVAAYVLASAGLLGHGSRLGPLLLELSERPARLSALSFGLTGLLGALILSFPAALRDAHNVSFIDSLFTAVSAVCVTGLVVHGTAETYTPFGQTVILLLVQVGGLGIMAMYAAFAVLSRRRIRIRSAASFANSLDAHSVSELRGTITSIVLYTFALEAVGAAMLYLLFGSYPATALGPASTHDLAGAGDRLWAAVFHSVSAFCNAGFSVFRAGVAPFAGDWAVSMTLMLLIAFGGFGFFVLRELGDQFHQRLRRKRPPHMSLHTRTVLATSGLLTVSGAAFVLLVEAGGVLSGRPLHEQLLTALFQSVTARTAGFNTLPIGELSAATLMGVCLLMFIGASPGSTGGGVKTTTVAVLFATFRSELRGQGDTRLMNRTLGASTIRRALGVFFLSSSLVSMMVLVLLIVEPQSPFDLLFEAVSAFATVGLSTGITGDLSALGKLLLTATMFVGRIGPMTLALALASPPKAPPVRLAEDVVRIG